VTAKRVASLTVDERAFQNKVEDLAREAGWKVQHSYRGKAGKGGAWRTNAAVGFPDLLLLKAGRLVVLELKMTGNEPTDEQNEKLDPVQLHKGERVYVVLETTVDKIRFDPVKDSDGWKRVHVLAAEQGMIVDESLVREHLDGLKARVAERDAAAAEAKRRQSGEFTLDEAALDAEHEQGQHAAELRDGCPRCDAERAAEAAEAGEQAPAEPASIADRRKRSQAAGS
jgi:hypothetical protein